MLDKIAWGLAYFGWEGEKSWPELAISKPARMQSVTTCFVMVNAFAPASQTQNQRRMHAAFCRMRILANNLPSEAYLTDRALMLDSHGCSSKGNPTLLLNHCRALLVGCGVVLPDWKKRYKAPQLLCYPSIVTHLCAL